MPFICDRKPEDMLDPRAVTVAGRAMVDKGTDRLVQATKFRTPIDTSPSGGLPRGRAPGTLRESITRGPVRAASGAERGWQASCFTEEDIAPYVEWNTRPHEIRPTAAHEARAAAEGHHAALRFPGGAWGGNGYGHDPGIVFARVVHHPGTRGAHMFSAAAAFVQAEVPGMFDVELARFGHDLTNGVRTVDDLLAL